jgi:hypothetical protein
MNEGGRVVDDERDKGQELKNIDEVNPSTSVKEKTAKELRKDKIKKSISENIFPMP